MMITRKEFIYKYSKNNCKNSGTSVGVVKTRPELTIFF